MSNKNFSDIVANIGSNVQDTSSAMSTVIKRMANEIYFDILRRVNFENINRDYNFDATTKDNVLPSDFGKEIAVYDSTNGLALTRTNQGREVDNSLSLISQTGSIDKYDIMDLPVRTQDFTEGAISVVSSDNTDNTQTIFVRGISDSVEITESLTLNGTTNVTSTSSYTRIIAISKSDTTSGKVTATIGSDTIAVFAPEDRDHKVKVMRLYAAPAQSTNIVCPYIIKPKPMVSDYDVPIIDIADIVELGGSSRAWQYKRQGAKAKDYKAMYEQGIVNLIWERVNQPNESHAFNIGVYPRDTV